MARRRFVLRAMPSRGLLFLPLVLPITLVAGWLVNCAAVASRVTAFERSLIVATPPARAPGCGTDANGQPTDNSQCGASGTNPYTGENATDLTSWCGGKLPGACKVIRSCAPSIDSGKPSAHKKYYLFSDLNCGASSLALLMNSYVDLNLNGHTLTGSVFLNGPLRGFHFFNGILKCDIHSPTQIGTGLYAYGCLDDENALGNYQEGGGDAIKIHHISGENVNGNAWYMRFSGRFNAPGKGWTEFPLTVYNNSFQAIPETTSARQHAGIYSENQPAEYFNNVGDCGSAAQANACQLLEIYSTGSNSYIHNNHLTCGIFNVRDGDTCRPILIDGGLNAHVQYNDIYPMNNRAIRLRDAFEAEVDHNFIHQLISVNGYRGAGIHAGDNDIHSGQGQVVPVKMHNNTFELGSGGLGIVLRAQQGLSSDSDNFTCYSGGCDGAQLMIMQDLPTSFAYPVTVDSDAATVTQGAAGNFKRGTSVKAGSVLTFTGFTQSANNHTFTVISVDTKVLKLADPDKMLVNEVSTTGHYAGMVQGSLYNPNIVGNLAPMVTLNQTAPVPILKYSGKQELTIKGNGRLARVREGER